MKTKIGIPIGLALVMFLGVFAAMLAFGTISPEPAHAQSADRMFSSAGPGEEMTVTVNVSGLHNPGNLPLYIGGLRETLPSGFTYVGGSVQGAVVDTT